MEPGLIKGLCTVLHLPWPWFALQEVEDETSDVQLASEELPPMEFDRARNASLLTRKSVPLEGATPTNLSRMAVAGGCGE